MLETRQPSPEKQTKVKILPEKAHARHVEKVRRAEAQTATDTVVKSEETKPVSVDVTEGTLPAESPSQKNELHPAFNHDYYYFRGKFWELQGKSLKEKLKSASGTTYQGKDREGNVVISARQKGYQRREDIRVYADEENTDEILAIKNEKIRDFSGKFDVTDSKTGELVGSLKRKGWKSELRDEWLILSPEGDEIGKLREQSKYGSAYLKRAVTLARAFVDAIPVVGIINDFIPSIYAAAPQRFTISGTDGEEVAEVRHSRKLGFNLFMDVKQKDPSIDRRLLTAANVLLCTIEGPQA